MQATWYRFFKATLSFCVCRQSQRNVHTMIFQSHVHSLQRVVTTIPINLHSTHTYTRAVWRCDGSHRWLVIAQIPVYLKHYFHLRLYIYAVFLWDKIKMPLNSDGELKYDMARHIVRVVVVFFFAFLECMFYSIRCGKPDFHVCWCWSVVPTQHI